MIFGIDYETLNYDTPEQDVKYEAVTVYIDDANQHRFDSGDLAVDWYQAIQVWKDHGFGHASNSSSVNHFIWDDKPERFKSWYMQAEDIEEVLEVISDHEKIIKKTTVFNFGPDVDSDGLEMFMHSDQNFDSWEQFKDYCKAKIAEQKVSA